MTFGKPSIGAADDGGELATASIDECCFQPGKTRRSSDRVPIRDGATTIGDTRISVSLTVAATAPLGRGISQGFFGHEVF